MSGRLIVVGTGPGNFTGVRIAVAAARGLALSLRIPGWARDASLRINGELSGIAVRPGSYAVIKRAWRDGDRISLDLPMPPVAHRRSMRNIQESRAPDGSLEFVPALLPKTSETASGYLPLTAAHLLRQGFKFLGERYGWGHSYNARDCSGFVSEIYRSFGVTLPRNTRDMAVSPALNRLAFGESDDRAARMAALRALEAGDLIFIPGHVMMVIGHLGDEPYVIHDTTGISYRNAQGAVTRVHLNAVSVSPLTPLLLDATTSYIDRIYSIQRIRK